MGREKDERWMEAESRERGLLLPGVYSAQLVMSRGIAGERGIVL